jgi:hypothetical protein
MARSTKDYLNCKMQRNDAGAKTVKEYFRNLLLQLYYEGEGFSGKRPFGNSNWEYEIYSAWVEAGLLKGTFDKDGYLEDYDSTAGNIHLLRCLKAAYKD